MRKAYAWEVEEDVFYGGRTSKELFLYVNVSVLSTFQDSTTIQHFFSIYTKYDRIKYL